MIIVYFLRWYNKFNLKCIFAEGGNTIIDVYLMIA